MNTTPKTAYDLLLSAPDAQVKRCQLAWRSIAEGEWADAAHFLRNAADEEGDTDWGRNARATSEVLEKRATIGGLLT
ncbi:hypothetical protein A9762_11520 [Pandoraea sp. ISTKB]|nr:hypothetical protein A9762_11520 [Pandoraea sp. ISTKB]